MMKRLLLLIVTLLIVFSNRLTAQTLPSAGLYSFAGATNNGNGTFTTRDGFFIISAVNGAAGGANNVLADQYGAYIDDARAGTSGTSYIQVAVNGGGSFKISTSVIGDFASGGSNDFYDVYAVGYLNGNQVAVTPMHNSVGVVEANYNLNFSAFAGVAIDAFRVYYSWSGGAANQWGFNFESITISSASTLSPPTVTTTAASAVGSASATLGGNVTADGGASVTERGIVWATTSNPTTSNNKVTMTSGTGSFSQTVSSLPSNTTIHFRAYATNSAGTAYGADQSFTTLVAGVLLSTNPALIFSNTTGLGDYVASDGEAGSTAISDFNIEIYDIADVAGTKLNTLTWKNNSFLASNDGTYSGLTTEFNPGSPLADQSGSKGTLIKSADGSEFKLISFKYYNWGESTPFTNTIKGYRNGSEVASTTFNGFDANYDPITVTLPATFLNVDEVRMYISSGGYVGDQTLTNHSINNIKVGPAELSPPTVTTTAASAITATSATLGGNVTADGGASVTERGIVWATTSNPTTSNNKVTMTSGTGSFSQTVSSLPSNTTIHFRAYATNSAGTAYGADQSFTTLALNPPVYTSTPVTTATENVPYTYAITATDADNDALTFTAPTLPAWLTFSAAGQSSASDFGTAISAPAGIAGDDAGNIYVTSLSVNKIYKIEPNGTTSEWINKQAGAVYAMTVESGYLYISYMNPGKITRVALNNPGAGESDVLTGLSGALTPLFKDGYMYVSLWNAGKVIRVSTAALPAAYNSATMDLFSVGGPFGLGFNDTGDLYIAQWNLQKVSKWNGTTLTEVLTGLGGNVSDIKTDANGYVYISFYGSTNGVRKYSPDLSSYTQVYTPASAVQIWGMSLTPSGALIFGVYNQSKIMKLETGAVLMGTPSHSDVGVHPVVINLSDGTHNITQSFNITVSDPNPPTVTAYNPTNGATDIAVNAALSLTFNEDLKKGTGNIRLKKSSDNSIIEQFDINSGAVSISGNGLTITPSVNLPYNTSMYVEIDAAAVLDMSDNAYAGITNTTTWAFTTLAILPTVNTIAASNIENTSAVLGGEITFDGGATVTERGIVYSTSPNPTTSTGTKVQMGNGLGIYDQVVSGLTSGVTYYYRAYAINSKGTAYGSELTVLPFALSPQTITAGAINKIYGDADFEPGATASSGLVVSYASADNSIAEPFQDTSDGNKWKIKIKKAGTVTITASQPGNSSYEPASDADFTLTIAPKSITVTAAAKSKTYGDSDPALTYTFSPGLIGSDSFSGALTRAAGENVGTYAITQGDLALSTNYTLAYTGADLTIGKKTITVTAAAKSKTYGDSDPALTYTFSPSLIGSDSFSGALSRAAGENVGTYAITQGDLALSTNYTLAYTGADLTIGKKTITVTAAAKSKTYGDSDPALTYTFSPALIGSDSFSGALSRAAGENIGTYGITQGDLALSTNYTLVYTGADLTIGKKTITVTAQAKSKTYGDSDPALTYTFSPSLIGSDSFSGALSRAAGENIGNYAITQGDLTLSNNYTLNYTGADLTIGKKTITVTAAAKSKTYGDSDPALTYTFSPALIGSDSFSGALSRAAGENIGNYAITQGDLTLSNNYTLNYTGADLTIGKKTITVTAQAKSKTYGDSDPALTYTFSPALIGSDSFSGALSRAAGENIGNYAITQGDLTLSTNYTLVYTGADLTIGKKTITVTAQAKNKTYGDSDPALTYTFSPSLIGSDSFSGVLSRAAGENVGNYAITQGDLALSTNYTLVYTGADLTIGKKTITVTAQAKSKTYGDSDPALTYTFSPALIGSDSFSGALSRAAGENIGTYGITQGDLALSTNYTLVYTGADLTIGKKTITVTAAAKSKTYGDVDPALTYTFSPALIGSDSFSGALSRAAGENIGTYGITQGDLALSTNYTLVYTGADLTIGKKTITVTAQAKSKTYGDSDPALTYTFSPALIGSDSFSGALSRAAGENIGNYAITQGDLALSNNYTLNYTGADLTIGKKTITVTAAAKSKTYGDVDPALTYTFSPSLIGSDSFSGALSRAAGENIGTYGITQGDLALSTNYTLVYTGADLTIGKKTITVTAAAKSKTYGDVDPALTYTFSPALIGSDSFSGALSRAAGENIGTYGITQGDLALSTNYTLVYTGADLTIGKKTITVTAAAKSKTYGDVDPALTYTFSPALIGSDSFSGALSRAAGENIGTYGITQGDLALSTNYTLVYTGADLTIGKKTITVTAQAKSKTYGDSDPALTYIFSPSLIGSDSFSGALSRAAGENIGNYAITQGDLALSNNYTLDYTGADLTIGKKTITVTAAAKNKTYGDSDPALTYTFSPALIGSDSFSGALSRAAGENIGNYAITQGDLALSTNYTINYTSADLTIGKKTITIFMAAKTKVYGSPDPAFTYTLSDNLAFSDTFKGKIGRTAGEHVGTYTINSIDLLINDNYELFYVPAQLSIIPKAITVTAQAGSKTYGATDPALTYTVNGLLAGDELSGALTRAAGEHAGNYAITQGSLSAGGDYDLIFSGSTFTITKGSLLIRAEDKQKVKGAANPVLTAVYEGFVNGESASVLQNQPLLSTAATTDSPVGSYPITVSGAAAQNYTINYQGATLTIIADQISDIALSATSLYENSAIGTIAGTLASSSANPSSVFSYSLVAGSGSTDNTSFTITGNTLRTAVVLNYESKSTYNVRIRSTNEDGQSYEKSFTVNVLDVNEVPTLNALADQQLCATTVKQSVSLSGITGGAESSQSTTLSVSSSNAGLFSSLTVNKTTADGGVIEYILAPGASGTAMITVTVKDNGGTANGGVDSFSRSFTLTVNALPQLTLSSDKGTSIFKGETAVLTATASGAAAYQWLDNNGVVAGQTGATLTVKPDQTTTYTVIASNSSGCSESKSITLTVSARPVTEGVNTKITNLMSPNGDGVNDNWIVENIEQYPNNSVRIVDRAGRLVYSKKGYDNSWDATLRGVPLAEGTYYYVIDFGDGKTIKKGFITILRKK